MKQPSFSDLEYANKKKTTRRERFLQEMDSIIPWKLLVKPINRFYPQGHTGRPPVPLASMLRIYFLQQWYGLSDAAAEDSLYDTESMRRFVGVDLDSIPDESTILRFRHRLEREGLTARLFQKVDGYLSEQGLIVNEGRCNDHWRLGLNQELGEATRSGDEGHAKGQPVVLWHEGACGHGYQWPGSQCGGDRCLGS